MCDGVPEFGWTKWLVFWLALFTVTLSRGCQAREIVLCTTGEHIGYAAQTNLFDFEGHELRMVWFESASLIPLPDSGSTKYSFKFAQHSIVSSHHDGQQTLPTEGEQTVKLVHEWTAHRQAHD